MDNLKVLHWVLDVAVLVFLVLDIATRDDITWIAVVFWVLLVLAIAANWTLRAQRSKTSRDEATTA